MHEFYNMRGYLCNNSYRCALITQTSRWSKKFVDLLCMQVTHMLIKSKRERWLSRNWVAGYRVQIAPIVVFSFSQGNFEHLALGLSSHLILSYTCVNTLHEEKLQLKLYQYQCPGTYTILRAVGRGGDRMTLLSCILCQKPCHARMMTMRSALSLTLWGFLAGVQFELKECSLEVLYLEVSCRDCGVCSKFLSSYVAGLLL